MTHIIKPHGGSLVNRMLSKKDAQKLLKNVTLSIKVDKDLILDLEKIAIGAYSPLKGFMNSQQLSSVICNMRLITGEPWTIPIFLPVDSAIAKRLSKNEKVLICEENGRKVGILKVDDIFSFHKTRWAKKVFGTDSPSHPGVKRLFSMHNKLIGGEVWMFNKPDFEFEKFNLTPAQTREIIRKKKWKTIAGFQTRNVPHRAHEYLQKIALTLTDGILIHPIIGWKKDGDFCPEVIIKAYKALIKDYFPRGSVIFAGLATAMRYAGPREAIFHAIIRKNYGCTHFIVGRDHAGVGGFYDKYDAHKIFDSFEDVGITPLLLREPFHCAKCDEMVSDKICPHTKKWHKYISGTMIRNNLLSGKSLPDYVIRKEISKILLKDGRRCFI